MSERKIKKLENAPSEVGMELDTFEAWFILNWKKVLFGAIILTAVVAVIAAVYLVKVNMERSNARALASAITVEQLEKALKNNSSGALACEARARLARLFVQKNDRNAALKQYQIIAADADANVFTRGRAILDSAYIYELNQNYKEAAAQFNRAAADTTLIREAVTEALYGAGRVQAAMKDYAKARKALNAAVRQGPQYIWGSLAQALLYSLPPEEKTAAKPLLRVSSKPVEKPAAKPAAKPVKK